MNMYFLLVVLVLITALLMRGNQQGNKKYIIVACLLLFAVYGLRDAFSIGNDSSSSYLHLFQRMSEYTWAEAADLNDGSNAAYYLLNKLIFEITKGDYQVYIVVVSAFVTFCFGRLVYRYSPDPLQSVLYHLGLLLYTFHFNALKQSIAMAIVLLAFDQIVNRRPFKFVVMTVIAALFHFPALVFMPAYWAAKLWPRRSYLVILAIVLALTYRFRNELLNFMLNLYKDEDVTVSMEGIRFFRTKAIIMTVIVLAASVLRVPTREDRLYNALLVFMGIAIVFQTFCGYNNIFERLADYYFQFAVVFIPMVFDRRVSRKSLLNWRYLEVINYAAPILFCGFGVYRFITSTMQDPTLYPYRFFFQSIE